MNVETKRILAAIFAGVLVLIGAWLGNADLTQRGQDAFFTYTCVVVAGIAGATYPFKE